MIDEIPSTKYQKTNNTQIPSSKKSPLPPLEKGETRLEFDSLSIGISSTSFSNNENYKIAPIYKNYN